MLREPVGIKVGDESSMVWKKTRQVIQTAAEPPKMGSNCFAAMGSTRKSRNDARKMALPKRVREWRMINLSNPATLGDCLCD